MKKIIIIVLAIWSIIAIVSLNWYNKDFEKKADIRHFYQTANRITNKEDFEYMLDTDGGRSIIQADLAAVDPVTLPQITTGKQFTYIKATYQEYRSHVETYTITHTDSKGHVSTEVKTRVVWRWDTVGEDSQKSQTMTLFEHNYPTSLFLVDKYVNDIPLKKIFKSSKDKGNIQSTGFNKRTIWKGIPAKFGTTFYGELNEHKLKPIQFPNQDRDSQIRLHANQPINKFLEDELEDNTPHPVIWTIVTIVIMALIAVGGVVIYTEIY